jgi:Transcriptional regulator
MQDVLREADLSAGAVYRYFTGKEDIVLAIATEAVAEVTAACEAIFDADAPPPLDEALGAVFAALERLAGSQAVARLAVQVWGEAVRSPALAERVSVIYGGLRRFFTRLVVAYQDRGMMCAEVPPEDVGAVLAGLASGFLVQQALLRDVDAVMFSNGVRALTTGNGTSVQRPARRLQSAPSKTGSVVRQRGPGGSAGGSPSSTKSR